MFSSIVEVRKRHQTKNTEYVRMVIINLSVSQVLLVLAAFACVVLAEPHRRYRDRWHGLYRYGYLPGRYYGRIGGQPIFVIIEDGTLTAASPVIAAPTAANPVTAAPAAATPVTAAPAAANPVTAAPAAANPVTAAPAAANPVTAAPTAATPVTAAPANPSG